MATIKFSMLIGSALSLSPPNSIKFIRKHSFFFFDMLENILKTAHSETLTKAKSFFFSLRFRQCLIQKLTISGMLAKPGP